VGSADAVAALRAGIGGDLFVDSVVLACDPGAVEDQIWDGHTLFKSGFTAKPEDDRTPGEFLIGELAFADTVLLADPELIPIDPAGRDRGVQLIRELAPHARVAGDGEGFRLAGHDPAEAAARTVRGRCEFPPPGPVLSSARWFTG
jgi:hypothetical protein